MTSNEFYHVQDENNGVAMRGTFVIDPAGILRSVTVRLMLKYPLTIYI